MKEVDQQNEPISAAVVNDFVFERVVKHNALALFPRAALARDSYGHIRRDDKTEVARESSVGWSAVRFQPSARSEAREQALTSAEPRKFTDLYAALTHTVLTHIQCSHTHMAVQCSHTHARAVCMHGQ